MNKANVFLLIVVSSLLTYISTATQPAATAGAAQEKWEYGISSCLITNDYDIFTFTSNAAYQKSIFLNRRLGVLEKVSQDEDGDDKDTDRFEAHQNPNRHSPTLEDWVSFKERQFATAAGTTYCSLGHDGWHPYQVIQADDYSPLLSQLLQDTVYWRRRVQ